MRAAQASLTATPSTIQLGQSTSLAFSFPAGAFADLFEGPFRILNNIDGSSSVIRSPATTTSYALVSRSADPAYDFASRSVTVTVLACNTTASDLNGGTCSASPGSTVAIGTPGTCSNGVTTTGIQTDIPSCTASLSSGAPRTTRINKRIGKPDRNASGSQFLFNVGAGVANGSYTGNIIVYYSDGNSQKVPFTVQVGAQAISIVDNPGAVALAPGGSGQTAVTLTRDFGASCAATLHLTGLPAGVTAPDTVIASGSITGSLTLTAAANAAVTSSPVSATINATCGSLTATAPLSVSVEPPPPGSLDSSFGSSGILNVALGSASSVQANGVAVDANDNILVVGSITISAATSAFIARYTSAGVLDSTFNAGGSNGGNGYATFSFASGNTANVANAVLVGPGTGITVIGTAGSSDMGVARFTSSGLLDTTFGSGSSGLAVAGLNYGVGNAGALQSDGKIVLVGTAYYSSANVLTVARMNANGIGLDSTFGISGFGFNHLPSATAHSGSQGTGAAVLGDGSILVTGFDGTNTSTSAKNALLVKLNSNGTFPTTFGTNGVIELSLGAQASGYALALQSSAFLVAGQTTDSSGNQTFLNLRTDLTGALDATFGTTGEILSVFPASGHEASAAAAMKLDANGKIVTAGWAYAGSKQNVALSRLSGSSGALDTGFEGPSGSGAGLVTFPITGGTDSATGLGFQSSGKLIVAGWSTVNGSSETSFIVRLLP